jgi:hypothetical protein
MEIIDLEIRAQLQIRSNLSFLIIAFVFLS